MKLKHRYGIKWRLIAFLMTFTLLIIAALWIFQTVFLDNFYRSIKASELEKNAKQLENTVSKSDDYNDELIKMMHNNICVAIYDTSLNTLASEHSGGYCIIHSLTSDEYIKELLQKTLDNNGVFTTYFYSSEGTKKSFSAKFGIDSIVHDKYSSNSAESFGLKLSDFNLYPDNSSNTDSMLNCRISTDAEGNDIFIILSTMITPVDATVQTLRVQLIIITAVLLIISVITAFIISKNISDPIIRLTEESKKLPAGEFRFDISENHGGYKEIDQLGTTLQTANDEINKVDELRKELIANVSHDLRTPLTLISGYSEMMRDIPGEITPENLQNIIDETERLSGLVSDMLSISKIEAGMQALETQVFCFTDLVEEIRKRYQTMTEKNGFDIRFEYDIRVNVDADRSKLSQVIANLLNNAINYSTDDKRVLIRQTVTGDTIKLEVIDHGIGIPKDQLANIWDRYYRATENHKRDMVGTGLGLSIVKKLLGLHSARYGVESTLGKGSCFWFEIKKTYKSPEIDEKQ